MTSYQLNFAQVATVLCESGSLPFVVEIISTVKTRYILKNLNHELINIKLNIISFKNLYFE